MWLVLDASAYMAAKVIATALSVMTITWAADRFSATLGGALAGVPIVAGPAMFFLWRDFGAEFTAMAAASSLTALSASQAFLVVYCLCAVRFGAGRSLMQAAAAWLIAAFFLSFMPQSPMLGVVLFGACVVAARRAVRSIVLKPGYAGGVGATSLYLIVARAIAAGCVVALATLAGSRFGAGVAGAIAAYPIGFSFVILTLHRGADSARSIATAYAAMLGLSSLAGFVSMVSILIEWLPAQQAFVLALLAGIVATGVTIFLGERKHSHSR